MHDAVEAHGERREVHDVGSERAVRVDGGREVLPRVGGRIEPRDDGFLVRAGRARRGQGERDGRQELRTVGTEIVEQPLHGGCVGQVAARLRRRDGHGDVVGESARRNAERRVPEDDVAAVGRGDLLGSRGRAAARTAGARVRGLTTLVGAGIAAAARCARAASAARGLGGRGVVIITAAGGKSSAERHG